MTPVYQNQVPAGATPHVTRAYPDGSPQTIEYLLTGDRVAEVTFDEGGNKIHERPFKHGKLHGTVYEWLGKALVHAERYVDGLAHGTAYQWDLDGTLLGMYEMTRGTGYAAWWQRNDGRRYLAEIEYLEAGKLHGYRWHLNENQQSVLVEQHYKRGLPHGIERYWDGARLTAGPTFFVDGERVSREEYTRASQQASDLPRYNVDDDQPFREFPAAVVRLM